MLARHRQALILQAVRSDGSARVSDLTQQLGVSDMTIRRDLEVLARDGLVEKVHGGAVLPGSPSTHEPGFDDKLVLERSEKTSIARAAASLIRPGTAVALSAGTTTFGLAQCLLDVPNLTIVTNSLRVASLFSGNRAPDGPSVVLTGGVRTPADALVGPIADLTIKSLHFDLLRIVGDRRDQGEWDALAAFCARHELAPEEPAERARFYLVTGQHERRRGLDPDGSRLGAAYWATSLCEGEREHMWKTLVTSEDLDGMRAVVNANSSRARVSAADRRHAIDLRGDLGDWGEVWRQAQSLRLLDATAAIAGIGPGWRPDSQSGTSLFVLLAAADLTSLRDARLALSRPRASTMNALRRLVNRPLAAWQPGDLGVALAAYRDMERYPAVRPLCELLVRCLECRYGDEVLIGADAQQPPTYQG